MNHYSKKANPDLRDDVLIAVDPSKTINSCDRLEMQQLRFPDVLLTTEATFILAGRNITVIVFDMSYLFQIVPENGSPLISFRD